MPAAEGEGHDRESDEQHAEGDRRPVGPAPEARQQDEHRGRVGQALQQRLLDQPEDPDDSVGILLEPARWHRVRLEVHHQHPEARGDPDERLAGRRQREGERDEPEPGRRQRRRTQQNRAHPRQPEGERDRRPGGRER